MKLYEDPNALLFALRLTEVQRWTAVATGRNQTVGEHSYRVCMIALAIHDYMEDGTPHNSYDRVAIASRSMTHDIVEILSGDLDSIFKIALETRFPGVYATVVKELALVRPDANELYTSVAAEERASKGTIVEAIVKLADFVEALLFINIYGTNNAHTQWTRDNILERLWLKLEEYKRAHALQRYNWVRVEMFLNLVLNQPGLPDKAVRTLDRESSAAQNGAGDKIEGGISETREATGRG